MFSKLIYLEKQMFMIYPIVFVLSKDGEEYHLETCKMNGVD